MDRGEKKIDELMEEFEFEWGAAHMAIADAYDYMNDAAPQLIHSLRITMEMSHRTVSALRARNAKLLKHRMSKDRLLLLNTLRTIRNDLASTDGDSFFRIAQAKEKIDAVLDVVSPTVQVRAGFPVKSLAAADAKTDGVRSADTSRAATAAASGTHSPKSPR